MTDKEKLEEKIVDLEDEKGDLIEKIDTLKETIETLYHEIWVLENESYSEEEYWALEQKLPPNELVCDQIKLEFLKEHWDRFTIEDFEQIIQAKEFMKENPNQIMIYQTKKQ